jgi:signal transduction histidine kinase
MERSQELTLSRERDRIARDLHDTVIQNLFATGLQLNAVERALQQGADVSQGLDDAIASIDRIVKEIRSTIFALSDDDRSVGPRSRLVGVIEEMSSVLGFTARMRFEGPVDTALEPSLIEQAVPVLRETLTNVAKHAKAGQVEVRVWVGEGRLDIEVVDDGVGLPAGLDRGGGFGLRNLTERAESLGGSARFESVQGRGARVLWSVPLITD